MKPAIFSNAQYGFSALAPTVSVHTVVPGAPQLEIHGSWRKRLFDLTLSAGALIMLAPLLVVIALAIKFDSAGPVLFRQRRSGLGGRTFEILKFRTMRVMDNGYVVRQASRDDDRITRIGKFLRITSLDELPQLVNVFKGQMSVVGPRPHAVAHDMLYGTMIRDYEGRFLAKPGMTGLAQVRGQRGQCRDVGCMKARVQSDNEYIKNWSFGRDIAIIAGTIPALLAHAAY